MSLRSSVKSGVSSVSAVSSPNVPTATPQNVPSSKISTSACHEPSLFYTPPFDYFIFHCLSSTLKSLPVLFTNVSRQQCSTSVMQRVNQKEWDPERDETSVLSDSYSLNSSKHHHYFPPVMSNADEYEEEIDHTSVASGCVTKDSEIASTSTSALRWFVFGGIASVAAESVTYPADTVKTRMQLQGQRSLGTRYTSSLNCFTSIFRQEGLFVLYRGLSAALLRQAIYGTCKYGLYDVFKSECVKRVKTSWITTRNVACAACAGAVSSLIAMPTDLIKVRMQSHSSWSVIKQDQSLTSIIRQTHKMDGFKGMYRGLGPTVQRTAVVAAVQLPVYDLCKSILINHPHAHTLSEWKQHLLSGFVAGAAACAISSPFDVVRTRMMNQNTKSHKVCDQGLLRQNLVTNNNASLLHYNNSFHCLCSTFKHEGVKSLFKGFVPAFCRMGPWNVMFFVINEQLKSIKF